MSPRLALALLPLLCGCAASPPGPLATSDLLDWPRLEAWADPERVAVAQAEGAAARAAIEPLTLGERELRRVVAVGLRGGEVRDLTLVCERAVGQSDRALRPWALTAAPHDGPAMAVALDAAGATRGELLSIAPERRLTVWRTALPGVYRLYERGPGDQALLTGVARAPDDRALDDLLPGTRRWAAVARRVERAVATGAKLEQLREEVACVEAIPFEDERVRARPIFEVFARELEQRRAAVEAAWPAADLVERCRLAREAEDCALAARVLDDGRHRALADRLRAAVRSELEVAAEQARGAGQLAAAAGWLFAAATFAGPDAAAGAGRARALAAPLVRALLPALDGPALRARRPGLDALYAPPPLGLGDGLLVRLGLAPAGREAHVAAAAAPVARLEVGPLRGDLRQRAEEHTLEHRFTRPNPAWAEWRAAMDQAEAQLQAAAASAAATANYTRVESYYVHFHGTDGTFIRTEKRDRVVTDEAMRAAHQQACAARDEAQARRQRLAPLEPPRRLPARTTYVERWQVWSGHLEREVTLELDGRRLALPQRQPAPSHRVRTAGSQASDLPDENIPASDGWTTAEAIAADAERSFEAALPDLARPALVEAMARRLEADVARRVAAGPGRQDELAWCRLLLGLPVAAPERARRLTALGPEETP